MNFSQFFRIIKIVTIITGVAALGFLFWQKAAPGGAVAYETTFNGESNFIYGPYPLGRVDRLNGILQVNDEPIYFDVYSPRQFQTAVVKLKYKNESNLPAYLGVKWPGEWSFYLVELEPSAADWHEQEIQFDMANAWRENNVVKFMFACSDLGESKKKVLIETMEVKLIK